MILDKKVYQLFNNFEPYVSSVNIKYAKHKISYWTQNYVSPQEFHSFQQRSYLHLSIS